MGLKPDLSLLRERRRVFVGDVKYKRLDILDQVQQLADEIRGLSQLTALGHRGRRLVGSRSPSDGRAARAAADKK